MPLPLPAPPCCNRIEQYRVREIACHAHPANNCQVKRDHKYFSHNDQYSVCADCFRSKDLAVIRDPDAPASAACIKIYPVQSDEKEEPLLLRKSEFISETNNKHQSEKLVKCQKCERHMHTICVNYFPHQSDEYEVLMGKKEDPNPDPNRFVCRDCGGPDLRPPFSSKHIAPNSLSHFIEKNLTAYHSCLSKRSGQQIRPVRVRCVSTNASKVFTVRPGMSGLYTKTGNFPAQFPFKSKAVFAFQEQSDGSEVVIFGFHANEYDHTCPQPNKRRVYLSYLDSVSFFQPKHLKTLTYYNIILSYFQFVKLLGYRQVSIWSCPPSQGDDYIFYAHPASMKIPKHKRLLNWYERLMDLGVKKGIIYSYTDAFRQACKDKMTIITQLPYFSGDHWPAHIEQEISEVLQQMRRQQEGSQTPEPSPYAKPRNPPPKRLTQNQPSPISIHQQLNTKIMDELKKLKEIFFTISLVPSDVPETIIVDPDPWINCRLFDDREPFLTYCRAFFHEFSNLRLAKYSTSRFIQIVVRDHTQQHGKYFQTFHHVMKCIGGNQNVRPARCDDPDCRIMRRLLKSKCSNEPLAGLSRGANLTGQTFQNVYDLIAKNSMYWHAVHCASSETCPYNLCRVIRQLGQLERMRKQLGIS